MSNWENDKGTYKVINQESPGDPIEINVNARPPWQIIDGSTLEIPHLVAESLNNAKKKKYRIEGKQGNENSVVAYEVNRYLAIPVDKKEKNVEQTKGKTDIMNTIANSKKNKVADGVE